MTHQLEVWVVQQVQDVVLDARKKVVQADDIVAVVQQTLTEMRAEETGPASDEGASAVGVVFQFYAPM